MESYDEAASREDAEDVEFSREACLLRKALKSRMWWQWLPWVSEVPSVREPTFFEYGSSMMNPRVCWQVPDTNLYLAEDGGVLQRNDAGQLVYKFIGDLRGQTVELTAQMRQMRESL